METYEKKYKEALERAKNLHKDAIDMGENLRAKQCEIIFPELAEFEDEQVRKEMLSTIKQFDDDSLLCGKKYNYRKWIAWLEKQGGQKPYGQMEKCIDCQFNYAGECKGSCAMKRSEQKPTEQVEPKFKAGNWITNGVYTWKIVEVKPLDYILQSQDGNIVDDTISYVDEQFHSFTIEDAKEGDVLCDSHEAYDNPLIFILKKFEHVNFGLVTPSDYSSYCFLTAGDKQRFKEGTYHHKHNIKPATNEQRDTLFQKMHEAGYTFDFEKKELKKIKFRVGDEIKTSNEESLTITKIDEKGYWSKDLFICDFDEECIWDLVGQKSADESAWSEEDEKTLNEIFSVAARASLRKSTLFGKSYDYIKWQNWLKSLRDRVQPQNNIVTDKELAQAKKEAYNETLDKIEYHSGEPTFDDGWNAVIWYLKKRNGRPQNTWKPSNEQIIALRWVLNNIPYNKHKEEISGLLDQIIKLK